MTFPFLTHVIELVAVANRSVGNINPVSSKVSLWAQARGVSFARLPPGKVRTWGGAFLRAAKIFGSFWANLTMAKAVASIDMGRLYSWYNLVMDWGEKVRENLQRRRAILEKSLVAARRTQREAPSAMESHSDTTKSEMEKLVTALEMNLGRLKESEKKLENYEPKYYEVDGRKVVLVPEGMGGDKIGEVLLVSETTPLGQKLRLQGAKSGNP